MSSLRELKRKRDDAEAAPHGLANCYVVCIAEMAEKHRKCTAIPSKLVSKESGSSTAGGDTTHSGQAAAGDDAVQSGQAAAARQDHGSSSRECNEQRAISALVHLVREYNGIRAANEPPAVVVPTSSLRHSNCATFFRINAERFRRDLASAAGSAEGTVFMLPILAEAAWSLAVLVLRERKCRIYTTCSIAPCHFAGHAAVQYAKYVLNVTELLAMSTEHHLEAIPADWDSASDLRPASHGNKMRSTRLRRAGAFAHSDDRSCTALLPSRRHPWCTTGRWGTGPTWRAYRLPPSSALERRVMVVLVRRCGHLGTVSVWARRRCTERRLPARALRGMLGPALFRNLVIPANARAPARVRSSPDSSCMSLMRTRPSQRRPCAHCG
jgi:hypothetical protein